MFAGIKYHAGKIGDGEVVYNAGFSKIKFLTDDSLPLGKLIYFSTMTIIIRCVFKQNGVYHPQLYLSNIKMIYYERIDCSEGIDLSGSEESVKCMICHYSYFKNVGFKYKPYICNGVMILVWE